MDKVTSLKKIAGSSATGDTVCEVLESMAGMGDQVGDNSDAIEALETSVSTLETSVPALGASVAALEAKFPSEKEIILASSTESSTKLFKITVVDNGTITATEYTPPTPPST